MMNSMFHFGQKALAFAMIPVFALEFVSVNSQITISEIPADVNLLFGKGQLRYIDLAPADVEITPGGENLFWEWTLNEVNEQNISYEPNDDVENYPQANFLWNAGLTKTYYLVDTNAWLTVGIAGEDPIGLGIDVKSFYSALLPDIYAPVSFDSTAFNNTVVYAGIPLSIFPDSVINMLPLVPDSLRAAINVQQLDTVDAWGTLSINDDAYDVLRQKRTNRIAVRLEAKISILPWTDVTDLLLDFVGDLPIDVDLNDTIIDYRFLSPGFTPAFAIVSVDSANNPVSVNYHGAELTSSNDPEVHYSVGAFPNPASSIVNLSIPDVEPGEYQIQLFQMNGALMRSESRYVLEDAIMTIDVSRLPAGPIATLIRNEQGRIVASGLFIRAGE